jgi:hypothetical protein
MSKRCWIFLAVPGALLLSVGVRYGFLQYRIARSDAFCEAVAALPRPELDSVASRCEHLLREHGGPQAGGDRIRDQDILAQFSLAGKVPYEVVVVQDSVGLKYIAGNWRYSTLAVWEHDLGPSGEPTTVFKIGSGSHSWWILSRSSEPGGAADRSQPSGTQTNRASAAAGSGR